MSSSAAVSYRFLSFNSKIRFKWVAKRQNKVRELYIFQLCNQLLDVILRKLSRVFFKNGLCGLGRRGVEQQDGRHVFTERLRDSGELLGQHPHADVRVAGAEKPSFTSSPVRPFTSLEAAQSSKKMSVLAPSKAKLDNFKKGSTWCCSQMMG